MKIPTMLRQPYIENSIWHGLMPLKTAGVLQLMFKKGGHTTGDYKNNGVGRKSSDPGNKSHISKGMSITEQRIAALGTSSH
jgi:LytS/YehU family sensor histidine kinase